MLARRAPPGQLPRFEAWLPRAALEEVASCERPPRWAEEARGWRQGRAYAPELKGVPGQATAVGEWALQRMGEVAPEREE